MKKRFLSIVVGTTLTTASQIALADLPVNANLTFDDGVINCLSESGTPPDACTYGTDIAVGSWFAMDTNDDGIVQPGEKIPINMDRGVFLGITQDANGNHTGSLTGTEDTNIDFAWFFFGNTGVHKTPNTAITIDSGDNGLGDGIASLDFSGWSVGWGANNVISLSGDVANFPSDSGLATVRCYSTVELQNAGGTPDGDCSQGDYYILDYAAHVPMSDSSGLGGVGYTLHLIGQQIIEPQVTVSIDFTYGNIHECFMPNGAIVDAALNVNLDPSDTIYSISWALDGVFAGNGPDFNQFVALGTHQVEVSVTTVNGASGADMRTVTVEDTQPPIVTAQFTNKLTGVPINTMQLQNNLVAIKAEAFDVCDPSATVVDVMYGKLSADGGHFWSYGYPGGFVIPHSRLDLRVEAQDASGNSSVENAVLNAP